MIQVQDSNSCDDGVRVMKYEITPFMVHKIHQRLSDTVVLIRDEPLNLNPGARDGALQPGAQARQAFVLVDSLACTIADGDQPDLGSACGG